MSEQRRISSYPATVKMCIIAESEEEAQETLDMLIANLGRFNDLSLVKGEME